MYPLTVSFVLFFGIFLLPVGALADNVSFFIEPIQPISYSCDSFIKDAEDDENAAIKKALLVIEETLDYISDKAAFNVYKDILKDSRNGLAETLKIHRNLINDTYFIRKMITDEMESKGPVTFIVGMCGQRKDNKIENIASAYSVAVTQLNNKK